VEALKESLRRAALEQEASAALRNSQDRILNVTSGSDKETSFDTFIELCKSSNLPNLPDTCLEDYKICQSLNSSRDYSESEPSGKISDSERSHIMDLSKFRRHMSERTVSKLSVRRWIVSDAKIEKLVCSQLFEGSTSTMESFLLAKTEILDYLQRAFYYTKDAIDKIPEVRGFQPIWQKFLKSIVQDLGRFEYVCAAQGQKYKLACSMFVSEMDHSNETQSNSGKKIDIVGNTDILVFTNTSLVQGGSTEMSHVKFLIELKSPFGALCQSAATAAKDQLLVEMEALGQMTEKTMLAAEQYRKTETTLNCMGLGVLTDGFAIAICFRTSLAQLKPPDSLSDFVVPDKSDGQMHSAKPFADESDNLAATMACSCVIAQPKLATTGHDSYQSADPAPSEPDSLVVDRTDPPPERRQMNQFEHAQFLIADRATERRPFLLRLLLMFTDPSDETFQEVVAESLLGVAVEADHEPEEIFDAVSANSATKIIEKDPAIHPDDDVTLASEDFDYGYKVAEVEEVINFNDWFPDEDEELADEYRERCIWNDFLNGIVYLRKSVLDDKVYISPLQQWIESL